MKKIFVDMDGVLCDFNKRYTEKFGRTPAEIKADRVNKLYSKHWHQFVDDAEFTGLEKMGHANELLSILRSIDNRFEICILSSAGGFDRQREVQEQKLAWLEMHDIYWPAVIVPGRKYKTGFAGVDALMIDDTYDVVESFIKAGGNGVWYKDGGENALGLIRGHVQ
jgi:FMN phosphatase YigB (HAD superfamily)